jgi:hypothetical protein
MQTTPLFGPYGSAAIEFIRQFSENGANACWFHGFDPAAFDACQKHAISACVEFKTFRADFSAHPELIPTGVDGKPIRYGALVQGVCLSQKEFLEETEASLLSGLRIFRPTGIWLDYLTYAGWFETPQPDLQDNCFCADCIAEFCNATGMDTATPEQIMRTEAEQWMRHKCERIAGYAQHYARIIRSYLPECTIGAYMCPWTPEEFGGAVQRIFGQDYTLLAPAIDIFTPLIYCSKSGRAPNWGNEFLMSAHRFVPSDRKVQLILDVLDFPDSLLEAADARLPSWGVQLFGGASVFQDRNQAKLFSQAVERMRKSLSKV